MSTHGFQSRRGGGAIATFLLDLEIRGQSRGARGLDELLYFLQRSTAIGVGYDDGIWLRAEEALALSPGTLEAVRSSAGVSLDVGLSRAGLRAVERSERRRSLGARLQVRPGGGFLVASVDPGGTAESAVDDDEPAGRSIQDLLQEVHGGGVITALQRGADLLEVPLQVAIAREADGGRDRGLGLRLLRGGSAHDQIPEEHAHERDPHEQTAPPASGEREPAGAA